MKKLFFALSLSALLFAGCSNDDGPMPDPEPVGDEWIDPVFAQVLQEKGYIENALTVTPSDVKDFTKIVVYGGFKYVPENYTYVGTGPIKSLRGLEYFASLEYFDCGGNQITELNVSNNTQLTYLYCNYNNLSSLDVSNNTQLIYLSCPYNNLSLLDVSNNTQLTNLLCHDNNLSTLDISNNTQLTDFYCSDNKLSSLNILSNTQLSIFDCNSNNLSSLDVSNNTQLTWINCNSNNLSTLDVSNNTQLESLYCYSNNLSTLDISNNRELNYFSCYNNPGENGEFVVKAWFDNSSIPSDSFTSEGWDGVKLIYENVDK